ncbi:MAG: hypothetical protein A2X13_00625 [Bacteroidetes bacterium GWC2_33_15]|nr:MAG: hypothetical protein A2X10_04435 [Bacteroidetes bacterium GWA2_33_15]OFX51124.1 MAG: hypothetical protein A2X13_00625 [Bacteroidetes bacterium GWC2_33_15]OFX66443.1 MAG: hypothetical protein A2X15_07330 [Bacteroidetes bacterium GWB2_32_14]OFX70332.1 MAG: hypothetical protein A2X14_03515 [Bacteroidetes bacterium GWD2_33_33]HAN17334.1 hypothetical protein [Bacteroidales bacterium]
MSERIYPIFHNGKKIYFSDWTNLKTSEQALKVMNETSDFVVKSGQKDLLEIIDVKGSYATSETLKSLKEINNKVKKYSKKKAFVGLTNAQRIILNTINLFSGTNIVGFDDIESAKDWLVK